MDMQNSEDFKTSDFYLACFLFAEGTKLITADHSNPRRVVFCFENSSNTQKCAQSFWKNEATINPAVFVNAIKELKQQLHLHGNEPRRIYS